MDFHVSLSGRGDLAARIYRQMVDAILDGRLRAGERLPPTRELADRLSVSRNTVAAAYDRLNAEGFLVARVGAGTFVCTQAPVTARRTAPSGGVRPRPVWESIPLTGGRATPRYDFRVGSPDPRLFPLQAWRRLVAGELRDDAVCTPSYADPTGHPGLRAAIARHAGVARSVHADACDVLVTQGAQQALDLIGRVLIDPGTRVAVEEPGYPPARLLFRSHGARVTGVPVDDEGLVVDALPPDARLVYVTPSHQFPLGPAMSMPRRAALLAWAQRHDAVVIEDDYDSEYRFCGRPLAPLQSLDRCGQVVYVGSFAKTLLPMLRIGFLVAPASLQPALRVARQLTDWHGDQVSQGALARFIDEGMLAAHVRRNTRVYAARRDRMRDALDRRFGDRLRPQDSVAGLHLCARLAPGTTADLAAAAARAAEEGVGVDLLADYCGEREQQPGLVLGYGAIAETDIDEGVRRLAASIPG